MGMGFFAEEGETMLEGHLVAHVYEKLKGDKQCLELNKVFTTFDLKSVCEKKTHTLHTIYMSAAIFWW